MSELFSTTIMVNNQPIPYSISFSNEEYHFQPGQEGIAESFIIKREQDEWHMKENIDEELKEKAIAVLEKYLLSQH